MPPRRSRRSPLGGLFLLALFLLGLGTLVYLYSRSDGRGEGDARPAEAERPAASPPAAAGDTPPAAEEPVEPPAPPAEIAVEPGDGAHVALVIDDLGDSLDPLAALERLGVPISYAVLPFAEETPAVAAALERAGAEVLCHLPMEAVDGRDPGPGALRLGMAPAELERSTEEALAAVPGAVGVNNHMGSGLSADPVSMESILGVLARRGLFYLDSRTSPQSVGYRVARSLGVPAAERQVFLDADPGAEAIRYQFTRLLALARQRGAAIAIGHPSPETLAALAREVPRAQELGYRFVPVSYLLDQTGEPPQ
ncbi:MAG TPA: divergent polysaccharide deacetylase family protein [Thermoanaerobaculia bacterium]|nr:divergent polysaccharide deacetylase family protein [Thermoanaerobaculia bacterium]